MCERAQATVEYLGIGLLLLVLLAASAAVVDTRLAPRPSGDAGYLALAARYAPRFVAERGDGERPVDFGRCRDPACAHGVHPVLYVHGLRRDGFTYLEYWEYLPESRTAHTGVSAFDGYHRDDWEGLIVKLQPDGTVAGARASAHLGWNGRHPWWELRAGDWAAYPAPVYRASGSHAGALWSGGIDLAGDRWDGSVTEPSPALLPADRARRGAPRFDPDATPPWTKQVWDDPEAVTTGPPGSRADYARYARWWAALCVLC